MILIEKENNKLKNVLPKNYARPELDKARLGELIDLFSFNLGSKEAKAKDLLGRVYEYFLKKFGSTEGEFYTPPSIVNLLVNMIEPYNGRVYDPCCGSGGMFVQSADFVKSHQGNINDTSVFGQEYTATTWRLAKMYILATVSLKVLFASTGIGSFIVGALQIVLMIYGSYIGTKGLYMLWYGLKDKDTYTRFCFGKVTVSVS
jgi:hypothetical protein